MCPDPDSSYTNKETLHEPSGFTYLVTSPHFPNRVKTYRGEDAGDENKIKVSFDAMIVPLPEVDVSTINRSILQQKNE